MIPLLLCSEWIFGQQLQWFAVFCVQDRAEEEWKWNAGTRNDTHIHEKQDSGNTSYNILLINTLKTKIFLIYSFSRTLRNIIVTDTFFRKFIFDSAFPEQSFWPQLHMCIGHKKLKTVYM